MMVGDRRSPLTLKFMAAHNGVPCLLAEVIKALDRNM
jgi:hypothetical protein